MATIIKKNLNQPEDTQTPEKVRVDTVMIGGVKIQRVTADPGWQWSKHLKPIIGGESCQTDHLIYVVSGTMHAEMIDGDDVEFRAGEVGNIPPGHDGWNDGDEPVVWLELPHEK